MSRKNVKKILAFLISSIASFAFLVLLYTLFNIKSFLPASPIVDDVPYKEYTNSEVTMTITLQEPKLIFLLHFNIQNSELTVSAIPKQSVSKDLSVISDDSPKKSLENFFKTPIDRTVTTNSEGLMSLINSMGGVETTVKYDIPFSEKYGATVAKGDQRISGAQLYMILSSNEKPDSDALYYYSELISDLVKTLLDDFTKNEYYIFLRTCTTDISYPDYYNYNSALKNCLNNITVQRSEGTWNNKLYNLN